MVKKLFENLINFRDKIIVPVPAELKEQFNDLQLKNSVNRIRIFSLIIFITEFFNALNYLSNAVNFEINDIRSVIYIFELSSIIIFNLSIIILRNKRKIILWMICYSFVAFNLFLYIISIRYSDSSMQALNYYSIIIPFILVSDFRPKIFISYTLMYFIANLYIMQNILIPNNPQENIDSIDLATSLILTIFILTLVIKILLYNSKVKTYVSTFKINELNNNLSSANREINKQKDELKNYNDNLEEMVRNKTKTIIELQHAVMEIISELVECRDNVTGGHISRTSYGLKIFIDAVKAAGLYQNETASFNIELMALSAQLHDVGKIAIEDRILRKPGKLTDEEFIEMKKHTLIGGEIIKQIQEKTPESDFLDYAYVFAVYHHEKWDGTGYPYGISGEKIPLPARLMAIIDVYDALISERPYKKPFTHEESMKIIKEGSGTFFDPELVKLFMSVSSQLKNLQ